MSKFRILQMVDYYKQDYIFWCVWADKYDSKSGECFNTLLNTFDNWPEAMHYATRLSKKISIGRWFSFDEDDNKLPLQFPWGVSYYRVKKWCCGDCLEIEDKYFKTWPEAIKFAYSKELVGDKYSG